MRYIFAFVGVFLLILIGLILIFGGGGKKKTTTTGTNAPVVMDLPDYAPTDAYVTMTTDGRVNGDDIHRAIRITVSRDQRVLDIVQGYSGHVIDSHSFPNNEEAYNVFLHSLKNSGFMVKRKGANLSADFTGVCPTGTRTIFGLNQSVDVLSQHWTTSCDGVPGTLGTDPSVLIDLFQAQITGYSDLTSQVDLD
jgi:hypothetical protein